MVELPAFVDVADIVQLHRKPGQVALGPHCQARDRHFQLFHKGEFVANVPFQLRPAHVFPSADGIACRIVIVRHQPGHAVEVSCRIGVDQSADHRFRARAIVSQSGRSGEEKIS